MKRTIAIALIAVSTGALAQNITSNSFLDAMQKVSAFWATHTCFLNSDVKAATDLIEWQRQRIAELEAKCGAACK